MARKTIEVDVGTWLTAGRGTVLQTTVRSPYVAIALSNINNGMGYLGNIAYVEDTIEILSASLRGATVPRHLLTWCGGAEFSSNDSKVNIDLLTLRQAVESHLQRSGVVIRSMRWLNPLQGPLRVSFRCGKDTCQLMSG